MKIDNSKLFVWEPDGWQTATPPSPGEYLVNFLGEPNEARALRVQVVPISDEDAVYYVRDSAPLLLPRDVPWKCEHLDFETVRMVAERTPRRALCTQCGASGRLVTRDDLKVAAGSQS